MDIFGVRRQPFMARRNYLIELRHLFFWGILAGLVEGTVSAVIVSKTFGASNFLITVVQATPAFANVVSLVWGALLIGRRKLVVMQAFGAACVAATLSVGLTPNTVLGGWLFAAQMALARAFMSGVVITRASIWKSNYPRTHRGRLTATLQIVRTLCALPLALGCGLLFDLDPLAYRWFYPAVAAAGVLGLVLSMQLRVRGERRAWRRRRAPDVVADADPGFGPPPPLELLELLVPWRLLTRMRGALRDDPRFARYITAQMCIGMANLMVMPVNTIVLTKVLNLNYTLSTAQTDVIPRLAVLLSLPAWARLYDRVGVLGFRVFNSACWSGSMILCGLGALMAHTAPAPAGWAALASLTVWVYAVGRIVDGLAQAGGAIAWNIGHLHFAEDEKAELYMGIHVSLTGVRGLTAPFLGVALYHWIDWGVFGVALALAATGMVLFGRLAREERSAGPVSPAKMVEQRVRSGDGVGQAPDLVGR